MMEAARVCAGEAPAGYRGWCDGRHLYYSLGAARWELGMGIVWSVVGIVVCGGLGGLGAWMLVSVLGLSGTLGAIAAAVVGMVLAVALWTAVTALLRSLRLIR
jgi:hypothetical protein